MVLSEADVLVRFAGRGADPLVATQAIYGLGQLIGDRAGRALIGLLRTYEGLLSRAERASRDAEELSELLARTCGALAQNGTVGGIEALTGHGLKLDEALGDCSARLAEASRVDFAAYPDLMKRLLDTLRGELPRSVLGIRLRKDLGRGVSLTRALSGTSAPEVRQLFETIVRTHGDQEIGEVAQRAILAWNEKAHPAETSTPSTLAGDLGFFGLPMLLQTLEQGSMTGCLSLMDRTGAPRAQVWLKRGEMVTATFRHLAGESAMYELLIRPFPGTFAFVHRGDGPAPGPLGTQKINTLVFEGVIRHDERQRAAALVGDTARLLPTGQPRSPTPNETADLGDALWEAVEGGATPAECEASMPYDSGQIRGLLAAWVEMEALQVA